MNNSVPLADVLPWGDTLPTGGRTILINDSAETNGRFLLHTMASQFMKQSTTTGVAGAADPNTNFSNSSKVMWITCGALTEEHILSALKKVGCDVPSVSLFTSSNSSSTTMSKKSSHIGNVKVISVLVELDEITNNQNTKTSNNRDNDCVKNNNTCSDELSVHHNNNVEYEYYLKTIYQRIQKWMSPNEKFEKESIDSDDNLPAQFEEFQTPTSSTSFHHLIILDDVQMLSTFFGAPLTHAFIQQIRSLIRHTPNHTSTKTPVTANDACLTLLSSHDIDQEQYILKTSEETQNTSVRGSKRTQYVGSGGRGIYSNSKDLSQLEQNALYELYHGGASWGEGGELVSATWERQLIELADGIIDVVPLASGFARDVHGRLIFTKRPGGLGWRRNTNDNESRMRRTAIVGGANGTNKHRVRAKSTFASTTTGIDGIDHTLSIMKESSFAPTTTVMTAHMQFSSKIVNYCCTDGGIRAIRLRQIN